MVKKKKEEPTLWVDEEEKKDIIIQDKPKKKRNGKYSKSVGNGYELKIVKELKELTGDNDIATARAESKSLDDAKIDIYDPNDSVPFYVQCKATQNLPQIKNINAEVGKTDKPLAIFWNAREKREINVVSVGEYVILPKKALYDILKVYIESNKE